MSTHKRPPATTLRADSVSVLADIKESPLAVLCGRNNSGKSFLLRQLLREMGPAAFYLGPARYHSFDLFGVYPPQENRSAHQHQQALNHFQSSSRNADNSPFDLAQAIAELKDAPRDKLLKLLDQLLGSKTEIINTEPDNRMSQRYVNVDGYNLAFQSSGFRLAATLLTSLLDTTHTAVVIDEPELGLSPEVQGIIADFLYDNAQRCEHFPHLAHVIIATHSPIFLDRRTIANNYFVSRTEQEIRIARIATYQELNELQLRLLGNRLETLHLPGALVLVEGPCDQRYLSRLLAIKFPASQCSVVSCNGDGRVRTILAVAKQLLMDIRRSPYANRTFIVLDQKHSRGLADELARDGVNPANIVIWQRNGIEHLYPEAVLEKKFGAFAELTISDDVVAANGIEIKKGELADFVSVNLTGNEVLPSEVDEKLLRPLGAALG